MADGDGAELDAGWNDRLGGRRADLLDGSLTPDRPRRHRALRIGRFSAGRGLRLGVDEASACAHIRTDRSAVEAGADGGLADDVLARDEENACVP